jgi:ABC-type multidrug transport system permease subunit
VNATISRSYSYAQFESAFATAVATISTSAFVGALGLLIRICSRSEEQAVAVSLILMFVLTGLGGAWVPLEFAGKAFQQAAPTTPGSWVILAYENVLRPTFGLLMWAPAFGLLASFRFGMQAE